MRGKPAPKRSYQPDLRHNNLLITRFVNQIMRDGKKTVAQKIVYGALDIASKKSGKEPLVILDEAMKNIGPSVEVKSRRVGGANYQIPIEVRGIRRETLAMRWIITAARSRKGKGMQERLAQEFLDASQKTGDAFKKKEDVRRMAEANRAFAHFA